MEARLRKGGKIYEQEFDFHAQENYSYIIWLKVVDGEVQKRSGGAALYLCRSKDTIRTCFTLDDKALRVNSPEQW